MFPSLKRAPTSSSESNVRVPFKTPEQFIKDIRYTNIGDLPSGFFPYGDTLTEIYARPFQLTELPLIHRAANTRNGIKHLIKVVSNCISVDSSMLTDGDFAFVMAWLRESSYPSSPMYVRWHCNNKVMLDPIGEVINDVREEDMLAHGLSYGICDRENNELVHQTEMRFVSLDDDFPGLPDFMDFPRMSTKQELFELSIVREEDARMLELARWLKAGTTVIEKYDLLDRLTVDQFITLTELSKKYYHGIYELLNLRCRNCGARPTYKNPFNFTKFFADNSDKNVMDIQYSLLSHFSLQPDDTMPVKKFLYMNSCLAKDLQAEEEARQNAPKGKRK